MIQGELQKFCRSERISTVDWLCQKLEVVQYSERICEENKWEKVNITDSGIVFANEFVELYDGDYKINVHNICCQHSELKHLKENINKNPNIVSCFQETSKYKQKNEIKNA